MLNKDFIEVETSIGPIIIRKDKITCIYESEKGKCVILPSGGDFIKIGVLEPYADVVHRLLWTGIGR